MPPRPRPPRIAAASATAVDLSAPDRYRLTLKKKSHDLLVMLLESAWDRASSDLSDFHSRLDLWRRLYEGKVNPGWKPWKDASEIFFPLPRMIADTANARMFQSFFQQREVAKVESPMQESDYQLATGESLHDALRALERFINHMAAEPSEYDLKNHVDSAFHEITQVGTAVIRTYQDFASVSRKKIRQQDGSVRVESNVILRNRVRPHLIPVERCVWDTTADEFEQLRFFGFWYTRSLVEIKQLAAQQSWSAEALSQILAHSDTIDGEEATREKKREGVRSGSPTELIVLPDGRQMNVSPFARYLMREVYLPNADVDADGVYEDAVLVWHPKSRVVPIATLFPYIHNEMPINLLHYEQRRSRNIGIGTVEPLESVYAGVNAVANQTIDAQTVRNVPSLIVPEDSDAEALLRDQGWSPGQVLSERSSGEIRVIEFAASGNTLVSMNIFDRLIDVAHRISHLGQAQFGDVSVAQRSPTDLGLSILAEGAQSLDKIINRSRVTVSRILHKLIAITYQTQPGKLVEVLGRDDARLVENLFDTVGINKLRVSVNVTSAAHSRELDRRNYAGLIQFVGVYHRQIMELVNLISGSVDPKTGLPLPPNPQTQAVGLKTIRAAQELMRRFVESHPDFLDATPIIPDVATDLETATLTGGGALATAPPVASPPGAALAPFGPGAGAILAQA